MVIHVVRPITTLFPVTFHRGVGGGVWIFSGTTQSNPDQQIQSPALRLKYCWQHAVLENGFAHSK